MSTEELLCFSTSMTSLCLPHARTVVSWSGYGQHLRRLSWFVIGSSASLYLFTVFVLLIVIVALLYFCSLLYVVDIIIIIIIRVAIVRRLGFRQW